MDKRNNYFEYRKVSHNDYQKIKLPLWIENEITQKSMKILDYGCGFGQIMEALRTKEYFGVYGVEIEKNAIAHCIKNNLNVKELDLENLKNPFDFKFDVIIFSHVIEHFEKNEIINILSFIKKEFLFDGGKFLVAVPNAQSNTNAYWAYEDWTHTTLFTSGSLYYVLRAAGFESVEFLDVECTLESKGLIKIVKKLLLWLYKFNLNFWNRVTCSSFHNPSVQIFSYEIKAKAY